MMKSAKPNTLKVPRRDGKSSIRRSKNVRHRGVSLNMESLEQRTLLSLSSATDPTSSLSAARTRSRWSGVQTVEPTDGPAEFSRRYGTIATVAAPSSTATQRVGRRHEPYLHRPADEFRTGPSRRRQTRRPAPPTAGPGQYDPAQQAALTALSGTMKAACRSTWSCRRAAIEVTAPTTISQAPPATRRRRSPGPTASTTYVS